MYRATGVAECRAVRFASSDHQCRGRRCSCGDRSVGATFTRWQFGLELKRFEKPAEWGERYRQQIADIRLAQQAGVPMLVGTDLGISLIYPGFSVHDEMKLLVRDGGLEPLDALKAATINPARAMRLDDRLGTIEAGKRADLILLNADPLADIANTARIDGVILGGRHLDRVALERLLRAAAVSLRGGR